MIENCARLADSLVITEMQVPGLPSGPVAQLFPSANSPQWDTWWNLGPELLVRFVEILGFADVTVTHHEQRYVQSGTEMSMPLFTVVAGR